MEYPIEITLKNGVIKPNFVALNISSGISEKIPSILLKIANDQSDAYSHLSLAKKYIFVIQELDEQTGPLSSGQQYLFENFLTCKSGKLHLTCINYPKLQCQIQIINEDAPTINDRKSNTIINLSGLESVEQQKQQQNKQQCGKDDNQWAKSEEQIIENPLGTPKKAEIDDFDKILSSQKQVEETIQNRYLRYFQQQFKVWRNFFDWKQQKNQRQQTQQKVEQQICTPTKQKPKSEHRKNSDVTEQNKIDNWSKRQNYSPDLKFTLSCGSPSNNENLSQFQKQKEKEVLSLLHSHQDNYRMDQQLQKQKKTMKKTNSEYRLNIQDISQAEKKDSEADTASKKNEKRKKARNFLQWADNWAEKKQPVQITNKKDEHVVKQWLGHIQNKYKIAKFMYE